MNKQKMINYIEAVMDNDIDFIWNEVIDFGSFKQEQLSIISKFKKSKIKELYEKSKNYSVDSMYKSDMQEV